MKVIVVGAGTMGTTHSNAHVDMPGTELVGIVDQDGDRALNLAQKVSTSAFESLEDAMEQQAVDVVDICVPTPYHKEYIFKAAESGKHVLCEKPLSLSLKDSYECIDICNSMGVRLFVGHVVRFFPEYRKIHELITSDSLGNVGVVHTFRGGAFPQGWNDWYAHTIESGSLIADLMIHDFDFLRWCFGDVERVYGKSLMHTERNRTDHALAILRFKNGVIANVEGSWAEPSGFSTSIEVAGSDGMIEHNSAESKPIQLLKRTEEMNTPQVAVPYSPTLNSPYYLELEHFLSCIRNGTEPLVSPQDAVEALRISLAVMESIRRDKPVYMDDSELGGQKI